MNNYPPWIDDYVATVHNAFVGMVPSSWSSLDFWAELHLFDGMFIARLHKAVVKLQAAGRTPLEVAHTFSNPSTIRSALYFLAVEYQLSDHSLQQEFREVAECLVAALTAWVPEDTFALSTNKPYTPEHVKTFLTTVPFQKGEVAAARELGRLFTACASLAFALYRDFFPQEANDVYGPYDVSDTYGPGAMLLIKHFPKIKPVGLWPQSVSFTYEDIKLYQIYTNVTFRCDWIGMHSVYQGDLIQNLVAWAVEANSTFVTDLAEVKAVRNTIEETVLAQMPAYDPMTGQDWLQLGLRWDCWQFNTFFELAGMDWEPTQEMKEKLRGKDAKMGASMDSYPSLQEYAKDPNYEAYWLKSLYVE